MGHEIFIFFNIASADFENIVSAARQLVAFLDFTMIFDKGCEGGHSFLGMVAKGNIGENAKTRVNFCRIKQGNAATYNPLIFKFLQSPPRRALRHAHTFSQICHR